MSERVCPVCGSELVLVESHEDEQGSEGARMVYACTTDGCAGRLEEVADDDAATANTPTGGDNIGA
jgi:hypothetical protein